MGDWTPNVDLQDKNLWRRLLVKIPPREPSRFPDDSYPSEYHPPNDHRDIQENEFDAGSSDYQVEILDPPLEITVNFFPSEHLNIVIDESGRQDYWLHIQEIGKWVRVAWADGDLKYLDNPPLDYGGNYIAIQNGWHVNKIKSFGYGLSNELSDVPLRIFTSNITYPWAASPRVIGNVNQRYWNTDIDEIFSSFGSTDPLRVAIPGMKALLVKEVHPNFTSNFLSKWYSDLYVYQFSGKKWKPLANKHEAPVFPDVLTVDNPNPLFRYGVLNGVQRKYPGRQIYLHYKTMKSIDDSPPPL